MYQKIKNADELLRHGDVESRRIVLDITEQTLRHLDAYERIKSITHMEGDVLCIGSKRWDLSQKRHVYLLGAGKACNHMARAVDEILGDHLTKGIAIVKIKEPIDVFLHTEIYVGGHPLPNETGLLACKEILKLVDNATEDDLFIGVVSGGSSALMSCPVEGISLQDEIDTTDIMLKSGASIFEINAIRRHISQFNGGMLAKRIAGRGAELIANIARIANVGMAKHTASMNSAKHWRLPEALSTTISFAGLTIASVIRNRCSSCGSCSMYSMTALSASALKRFASRWPRAVSGSAPNASRRSCRSWICTASAPTPRSNTKNVSSIESKTC